MPDNVLENKDVICVGPCGGRYKGGIAQFFTALVTELRKKHQVGFISWEKMYPSFLLKRNFEDTVSQEKLDTSGAEYLLNFNNPFSFFRLIKQVTHKTELVVLNWSHPVHAIHYTFLILVLRFIKKTKVFLICHNVTPHENFLFARFLTKTVFSLSNRVIVHSQSEANKAAAIIPSKKTLKLFMPVFDFFKTEQSSSSELSYNLLYFGIIREYKGVDILLQAFAVALKTMPALKLTIAGEYFYSAESKSADLEQLIKDLDISENVEFINRYIANEEIPALFDTCDAAVFPFRSVTQSASLTLAIAYSKPMIVSDLPAFTELVKEGETGSIFKTANPDSLTEAILRFYSYDQLDENVTELQDSLSWRHYAERLIAGLDSASS